LIVTISVFFPAVCHMDEGLSSHDAFGRAPCNGPDRTVLPQPSDELRVPAHCDRMELLTIESVHLAVSGLAKLGCPFKYRVEDWCEVARRTGDDLKHLQGRRLLFPRLGELAGESCDLCIFA
jgi:hypothetical protein